MSEPRKEQLADGVTLWLGNCREVMCDFDKSWAIVTDPPWGANYDTDSTRFSGLIEDGLPPRGGGRSDRTIVGDSQEFDPAHLLNFDEVITFGSNHYAERLPRGTTLVWLKRSPQHYGTFLSDAEIAWQRGGYGVYVFYAEDSNARRRREFSGSAFGSSTAHPTQKPICLMEWCVGRVTSRKILDPYMGSGSTGVACINCGRDFAGVELVPSYFDIARRRLTDALRRPPLPFEEPRQVRQAEMTL